MKRQKPATFAKESLIRNTLIIAIIAKFKGHCHYSGKYRGGVHSKCNLKYSKPKEILVGFYSGSNCGYHFFKKRTSRRVWRRI